MADNQITPFQLTDQFTMDNFNQRINETNTALQNKADSSSVYTKSESISAETRTALSLAETATPDTALAEIARQLSESGIVRMVELWVNAYPTSTFLNQTVQIDLTMYPIVAVEDTDGVVNYFANPTTSSPNLITIVGGGSIAAKIYKRMCKVTPTGVIFGSCLSVSALNQTTTTEDNGKCIPLNIYGITR